MPGWAEARLGMIPHVLDQIAIGDIERSRLTDIRVLFFLGMNEGVIPQPGKDRWQIISRTKNGKF